MRSFSTLQLVLLASWQALAQNTPVPFTAPISVGGASPAVPAQCPAVNPVSCTAIQQPYYCCPANYYCAWYNSQVACCPLGQTCYGAAGGWTPTATTNWYPPATTTVAYGGAGQGEYTTTIYTNPNRATTTVYVAGQGEYCSTLTAKGANLPTTAQGQCGTILVVAPSEAAQRIMAGIGLLALNMFGVMLFVLR